MLKVGFNNGATHFSFIVALTMRIPERMIHFLDIRNGEIGDVI